MYRYNLWGSDVSASAEAALEPRVFVEMAWSRDYFMMELSSSSLSNTIAFRIAITGNNSPIQRKSTTVRHSRPKRTVQSAETKTTSPVASQCAHFQKPTRSNHSNRREGKERLCHIKALSQPTQDYSFLGYFPGMGKSLIVP